MLGDGRRRSRRKTLIRGANLVQPAWEALAMAQKRAERFPISKYEKITLEETMKWEAGLGGKGLLGFLLNGELGLDKGAYSKLIQKTQHSQRLIHKKHGNHSKGTIRIHGGGQCVHVRSWHREGSCDVCVNGQ